MNIKAILKASGKIERMREAYLKLTSCKKYQDIRMAWEDFILASGTFYSCLEQGAKVSPKSQSWFGKIKSERKKDNLLQYIHQARNAEEHGIVEISAPRNSFIELKSQGAMVELRSDGKGTWEVKHLSGRVNFPHDEIALLPVYNRGVPYSPPTHHLGTELTSQHPKEISKLAIEYFERVMREAKDLEQPHPSK